MQRAMDCCQGAAALNQDQLHERLDKFLTYEKDWDSYGADPINPSIVARAHALVDEYPTLFTFVAPICNGSVQLERNPERATRTGTFFELEFTDDTNRFELLAGRYTNDGFDVGIERDDVTIAEARNFLSEWAGGLALP